MLSVRIWRKFRKHISNGKHLRKLNFSTENVQDKTQDRGSARMGAWQIHSYGGLEELQLSKSARLPSINSPNEVLVKVLASSVNPIDIMMLSGYGSALLNTLRQFERGSLTPELEFPLTLGRDCCGQLISKGNSVGNGLNVGDTVYGVVPVHQQGCHAENVILNKNLVRKKPDTVTPDEATSLLYAGMTAWSALKVTGDLWFLPPKTKKVLIIGASGGVGTVATQLLKAWEAEVVAVCNKDAVPLVKSLNADHVIDYTVPEAMDQIAALGKYDVILDAAGLVETESSKYIPLLKDWSLAKYITLRSPFLRNFDTYGLLPGIVQNAKDILFPNISSGAITRGSSVRWAFFLPIPDALNEIDQLIAAKKIRPVIHKSFDFSDLPNAYKEVQSGHLRGKVVIVNRA